MKTAYKITVGNIGVIIETESYKEARKVYDEYVSQSEAKYGRASGEEVILWKDGEPLVVHYGRYNA